jgi:hypothetical protein
MHLVFPTSWDLDDNPEVLQLLHLKTEDFEFLRRSSTLDPNYRNTSPALRRIKAVFHTVFFLTFLRIQAIKTQSSLAITGRVELDDSLEMYVPVLASWFSSVFGNLFRSLVSDASVEPFIYHPGSLLATASTSAVMETFRMRFSVFLRLLYTSTSPPSALLHLWPRLAGTRLYLPESLAAFTASALPTADVYGARSILPFSVGHECLGAFVAIYRGLVEAVLLRRCLGLMKQRDAADSALGRAAGGLRLMASLVACVLVDEFIGEGVWSPSLFGREECRELLKVLSNQTLTATAATATLTASSDAVEPVDPLSVGVERQSFKATTATAGPSKGTTVKPRSALNNSPWSNRTSTAEICQPISDAPQELRRWVATMLQTPFTQSKRRGEGTAVEQGSAEEDVGRGRYVVIEKDGADIYVEPTTFNPAVGRLELGKMVEVTEVARAGTWLRMEDGRWLYGKTRFTGEPTMAKVQKVDETSAVYFVKEKVELYEGPVLKALRKGDVVEKFTVVEVLEVVRVDVSAAFGVKFLRLPQGWIADKVKAREASVVAAIVNEKSEEGLLMYRSCCFQSIRPWRAPDWKSKKVEEIVVEAEAVFNVDLVVTREDGSEWVRTKKEGVWLPLKHSKITTPVICKLTS